MKLFSKLMLSTALISSVICSQAVMANPAKSTNIKAALINQCKTTTTKGGKLTAAEVNKFCNCQVESQGKMTIAQTWEIQSAINAKKQPSSLPFVQRQNQELQACFGPQLTAKLKTLTEQAMKSQAAK